MFNQLQTYKQQIPALFHTNALLATSDGIAARVGLLSADLNASCRGAPRMARPFWKKGLPELPTLIEGVFEKQRFLDVLRHFTVFGETGRAWQRSWRAITNTTQSTAPSSPRFAPPTHGTA